MDGIDTEVKLLLNELIDFLVETEMESFGTDGVISESRSGSLPSDLTPIEQESTESNAKANLEFFSDIFDIMPTQCYASQRESPKAKRTDFLSPLPPPPRGMIYTPARTESIGSPCSPVRSQWNQSQDLFKSPPLTPRNRYAPTTPGSEKRRPLIYMNSPKTPKSNLTMTSFIFATPTAYPNQSLIMASPAATPRMREFPIGQSTPMKFSVPLSPGSDLIRRLNDLLPKRQRVDEDGVTFKVPGKPAPPRWNGGHNEDRSSMRAPPNTDNRWAIPSNTIVSTFNVEKSKPLVVHEFCPPLSVGAYSTAPMSLRSSRAIRVGLSRKNKRSRSLSVRMVERPEEE